MIATFKSTNHVLPKFEVFIDNTLTFSLRVYGWMLSQNHELYSKFNKSFHNVTFSYVRQFILCKGISTPDPEKLLNCQKTCSQNLVPTPFFLKHFPCLILIRKWMPELDSSQNSASSSI